jgi:hypothetical protein
MTSSRAPLEDEALARENAQVAHNVVYKLRAADAGAKIAAAKPGEAGPMPAITDALTFLETSIDTHPRETLAMAAVIAFALGTLWRRGYLS